MISGIAAVLFGKTVVYQHCIEVVIIGVSVGMDHDVLQFQIVVDVPTLMHDFDRLDQLFYNL
jgi:hypothetical protein